MSELVADVVVDSCTELGEMPLWCARSQTLFWIDLTRPGRLLSWHATSGATAVRTFPHVLTNVALHRDGGLVVASERQLLGMHPESHATAVLWELPDDRPDHRFNDGACDRHGRLWIGTMESEFRGRSADIPLPDSGRLYCISADLVASSFEERLRCPNAITWSPDSTTLYFADSLDGWIYSAPFDAGRASYGARRPFFALPQAGLPDGAAVDAEGCIWNARWGAGMVARITPAGILERIVRVPASQVSACAFGGPDLRTLFITSARVGLGPSALSEQPHAGALFAIHAPVPGVPMTPFGGS